MAAVDDPRPLAGRVVDLLVGARGEEGRERVDDRQEPLTRQPRGHRDHVLLGDADLDEPLRVADLEAADAAIRGQVGVEDDQFRVPLGEVEQRLAVRLRHVFGGRFELRATPRAGAARRLSLEARTGLVLERRHRLQLERPQLVRGEPLPDPPGQLGEGALEVLMARRACVPAVRPAALLERDRMLHERDALPFDRPRHQDLGPLRLGAEVLEHLAEIHVVVTVADVDVPAEAPQLLLQVAERDDLLGALVGLELVPVDDHDQVADFLVRTGLQRLPVLPLLQLAVAGHHDHATATAEEPLRPGHPAPLGDAHAERARVRLDARHADVRMAVEAAQPAQPQQSLRRDDAERMEHRVQTRHVVALGREVDVAVGVVPAELRRRQRLLEQVDDDVHGAEGRAQVAGAGPLHGGQRVRTRHVGEQLEAAIARHVGEADALELAARDERELDHPCHGSTSIAGSPASPAASSASARAQSSS